MSYDVPTEAICPKGELHDFNVILDNEDVTVEICRFCSKKEIYKKINGCQDNKKHLRAHLRDTVQPYGATRELFLKIYGEK